MAVGIALAVVWRVGEGVRALVGVGEYVGVLIRVVGEAVGLGSGLATWRPGARPKAIAATIATRARASTPTSQTCLG